MARLPRLAVPGEAHYVLQQGHNRQPVFIDDEDRHAFVNVLREAAREHGFAVHAYALLDHQVGLLGTPADGQSLGKTLQAVGRRYVPAFNRRHQRSGTLWEGRFRACVLESERYLVSAMCLLESAPVSAALAASPDAWPWSSARHHLGGMRDPLVTDHPLYWALGNTPFDREAAYRRALDQGVPQQEGAAILTAALKSWALGSPAFLARLAELTARPLHARPRGRPRALRFCPQISELPENT
jgi:putative transposase